MRDPLADALAQLDRAELGVAAGQGQLLAGQTPAPQDLEIGPAQLGEAVEQSVQRPAGESLELGEAVEDVEPLEIGDEAFPPMLAAIGAARESVALSTYIFDNDEIFPSGYSYVFMNRDAAGMDTITGIPYYFPQATRNFVLMLDLRL